MCTWGTNTITDVLMVQLKITELGSQLSTKKWIRKISPFFTFISKMINKTKIIEMKQNKKKTKEENSFN